MSLRRRHDTRRRLSSTPSGWRERLVKLVHMVAEQALPLTIAGVSFVIALDAWLSARPMQWEHQRALASLSISSDVDSQGKRNADILHTLTITNVGELSFAVLDIQLELSAQEGLRVPWSRNTLLQDPAVLPIGLRPFHMEVAGDRRSARLSFRTETAGWHVIDPGRSVDLVFAQPLLGHGRLGIRAEVFTQPLRMAAMGEQMTVERVVAGRIRHVSEESGMNVISDLGVYPYTAATTVMVPGAGRVVAERGPAHRTRRWQGSANH